jgi:hypothetical protein
MTGTTLTIVIVIAALVLAAIAVVGLRLARQKQTERLRKQYGPEYDRAVAHSDNQREAESELRDLDTHEREGVEARWKEIQAEFVDDPSQAVRSADQLVVEVMSARGYPVDDFDQRADDLSVSHPQITRRYRDARKIAKSNEDGSADTEDLRRAVTSYRELVHALLNGESDSPGSDAQGSAGSGRRTVAAHQADDQPENNADDARADTGRGDMGKGARDTERNGHATDTNGHQRNDRESVRPLTRETKKENS